MMDTDIVKNVRESEKINDSSDLKLKKDGKASKVSNRLCMYFKNIICRIPFCDLEVCSKCPKGYVYCATGNPNPLRDMMHRVIGIIAFLISLIAGEEIALELLKRIV